MKKYLVAIFLIVLGASLLFAAGAKEVQDTKTILVGATPVPHAAFLNLIVDDLAASGYTLKVREFTDYVTPNEALESGELDANFFQHIPYLETFNKDRGFHLVNAGGIHVEPFALYSDRYASLEALPDGATIAIPNDPTNEGRALLLLESAGLLTLDSAAGLEATPLDIVANPKNLRFREIEAASLPRVLKDVDGAIINGNYAIEHGLNPLKDAILVEGSSSPYVNIVAVKDGRANEEALQKLLKALQSDKIKTFIEDKYDGAVIPAFQSKETADKLGADY